MSVKAGEELGQKQQQESLGEEEGGETLLWLPRNVTAKK